MGKIIITLIIIITVLLALWFWWFQWRPSQIRKDCNDWAIQKATEFYQETYKTQEKKYSIDSYNSGYERCLHSKGLE
jgi:hypothetical protein